MQRTASGERLTLIALAILSAVLRSIAYFRYRFDSDEPQHLHVAWGWTAGLLQYRDIFDNHAPLFHMLTAPFLGWVGERPDVLLYMRAPMLPLFAVVVAATYLIGRRLYSARVGVWAALLLSLFPPFFLKSLEYRTDNLWNAFWFLALLVLTGGPLTTGRSFFTGLLLGCAMATSMKTILLILTLAGAGLVTYGFTDRGRSIARALRVAVAALIGLAIVPSLLAAYFYARGAWPNLVYCVVEFNSLAIIGKPRGDILILRLAYIPLLLVILRIAWEKRAIAEEEAPRWRFFFAVAAAFFAATLLGFWIMISPRDLLPLFPIATIFFVASVDRLPMRVALYIATSLIFVAAIGYYTRHFENRTDEHVTMMRQVLRLTRPEDPILDYKGETIFRRRPYYYIFEMLTRRAMQRGLIADSIAEDVVRARCHVAQADGPFWPPRGGAFLATNFLDMGRLRTAGQWIKEDGSFSIAVPGEYVILTEEGHAQGTLDSLPYSGPRLLGSGGHTFVTAEPKQRMACVWAPAFQRGHSPFHLRDREFPGSPVFDPTDRDHRAASGR
jgi:MFS family permease